MSSKDREDYVFIGGFSPREVKRFTHFLEAENVDYEVEFDDSEIKEMSPIEAAYGGFGASAKVNVYVDPGKMLEVDAILETLYPP